MTDFPDTPEILLPQEEVACLQAAFSDAEVILEYGSGGTTALAAQLGGKTVFSVESDRDWAKGLQGWLTQNTPDADVRLHLVDLGPTKDWGHPKDLTRYRSFPKYPLSVWDRTDFVQPDVVFIDGRFRAGCLLAVLYRTKSPVSVYFDDYLSRDPYRVVEEFVPLAETRGRMARFDVKPGKIDPTKLGRIIDIFGQRL